MKFTDRVTDPPPSPTHPWLWLTSENGSGWGWLTSAEVAADHRVAMVANPAWEYLIDSNHLKVRRTTNNNYTQVYIHRSLLGW